MFKIYVLTVNNIAGSLVARKTSNNLNLAKGLIRHKLNKVSCLSKTRSCSSLQALNCALPFLRGSLSFQLHTNPSRKLSQTIKVSCSQANLIICSRFGGSNSRSVCRSYWKK